MSDETTTRPRWQRVLKYSAGADPVRSAFIDGAWERAKERASQPKLLPVWKLPGPQAGKPGEYLVVLDGLTVAVRGSLVEAARVALSLKRAVVRSGGREWGREELRGAKWIVVSAAHLAT